jgi:hypothetical protein
VAAAAYLQMTDMNDQYHLGFVMGKAKLAPQAGHSIPSSSLSRNIYSGPLSHTFIADKISIDESLVAASTGLR